MSEMGEDDTWQGGVDEDCEKVEFEKGSLF